MSGPKARANKTMEEAVNNARADERMKIVDEIFAMSECKGRLSLLRVAQWVAAGAFEGGHIRTDPACKEHTETTDETRGFVCRVCSP